MKIDYLEPISVATVPTTDGVAHIVPDAPMAKLLNLHHFEVSP